MRPKDYVKVGLGSVLLLILLILFFQNASTRVSVVMLGERSEPMPLSIPIVIAYVSGGVIGWLLLSNWWLHDYLIQRKTNRLMERLENRLYDLEERLSRRPDLLLPRSLEEQGVQRERLSVDDFEVDEDEDLEDPSLRQEDDWEDGILDEDDRRGRWGSDWPEERRWDY